MGQLRRLAVPASILAAALLLTACVTPPPVPSPPARQADPVLALTDPESPLYVADGVHPYLYEHYTGPVQFGRPAPDSARLAFYLTCSPESEFRIELGSEGNFYAGTCGEELGSSGTIPVELRAGRVEINVVIPVETTFSVVALPAD